jgi:hypothetical protein
MTLPTPSSDTAMRIYLTLNLYPILKSRMRAQMRQEMFTRGVISKNDFEAEAVQKAIQSQRREGLQDPYGEESADVWDARLSRVRDSMTDFYFAYNLPYDEFERIVRRVVAERGGGEADFVWFNPELAPQDLLFEQAELIEKMPPDERESYNARLQEIKVVLIRTMVSDHLNYLKLARQWYTVGDLKEIRQRKIGGGKIGGKAAGMLLAMRILREKAPPEVRDRFKLPVSYYVGSDLIYQFISINGLMPWTDQKYKTEEQMRADYPRICAEFAKGRFPEDILVRLRDILSEAGTRPVIVRSSSLLEDSFGTSFAGKYESIFCPNQGSPEENLDALTQAIARVYASALNPDALLYRHHHGLADYDERLAILIQFVEGEAFGRYYLPQAAGVAFSRNLYRWSPQIRKQDGFLRLVWGLGTRAVDQQADDYPRLVALSHPLLHPAADPKSIRRYSQQYVDVIDLQDNLFKTLPIGDVLTARYGPIRYLAQVDQDGYLGSLRTNLVDPAKLVLTFEELLRRTPFAETMRTSLQLLEKYYNVPVDTEFTLEIPEPNDVRPEVRITLLQCRPQSQIHDMADVQIPENLATRDVILSTRRMVTQGMVDNIRYVLFVSPAYFQLHSHDERSKLERAIGLLNAALEEQVFIAVGPGRWGTSSPDLGVHVTYADIYNARALIEVSGKGIGAAPEPSFGTHFFQDLMETSIYPLAVYLDDSGALFNQEFFNKTPNHVKDWIKVDDFIPPILRLIDVRDFRPVHHLRLVMDDDHSQAVAYLQRDE